MLTEVQDESMSLVPGHGWRMESNSTAQLRIVRLEKTTYRAGTSSDDTVERQGIWNSRQSNRGP